MHRSGTSALAGALRLLGVDLGGSLLAPTADNVTGFWEHAEIVGLHERVLSDLGSSWDDVRPLPDSWWTHERVQPARAELIGLIRRDFARARVWGVKDPRMCKLAPLWRDVLDELGCECRFILIHRHPAEVACSLQRRNGFAAAKSALLWLEHNLLAEKWTRGQARLFLGYDQLLAEPRATVHRIAEAIGHGFADRVEPNMGPVSDFLAPQLRHHARPGAPSHEEFGAYAPLIGDTCELLAAACQADSDALAERFDGLGESCEALTAAFDPALAAHVGDLQKELAELRRYLGRIRSSLVWRLLRPLRGVERRMR